MRQKDDVPHPIPYQGSKRLIAQDILAHFPSDVDTLFEPFAGSAAVSLAAARVGRADSFHLSDSNAALIRLWSDIIERPEETARAYAALWHEQIDNEREFYDYIRAQFNRDSRSDHFLYLLARCVKASVRYNTAGEFNQSPDNRRRGARPTTMTHHIRRASRLLCGRTVVKHGDYRECVAYATPRDLIYMDPPYQGVSGVRDSRYLDEVKYHDFSEALAHMNERSLSYIVSYDGHNCVRSYGKRLPEALDLKHIFIHAGRSTQATLLGRDAQTVESLYLSPALVARLECVKPHREVIQHSFLMEGMVAV